MTSDDAALLPTEKRVRAAALPPSERRAEIIATTLPLLMEHGAAMTTRQIAEAAGIAEGTIFRVFEDKQALIDAVVEAAIDPAPTEATLREIDLTLPLEQRLYEAVEILRRRTASVFQVMAAAGATPTGANRPVNKPRPPELRVLGKVFEPDPSEIDRDPQAAAYVLRALTIVGTHPLMIDTEPMASEEIVALVLDGVRARPAAPPP
ncbi:TetR/AcrR family transcriptional regulator [Aquihabitans sp. McL0605]|uniref:TetR/AcrR family transcriptional regulator n=1 Tax=Aquihabitans sp. McL0605 TaxID=3415671 RepID=UPI003CF738DE